MSTSEEDCAVEDDCNAVSNELETNVIESLSTKFEDTSTQNVVTSENNKCAIGGGGFNDMMTTISSYLNVSCWAADSTSETNTEASKIINFESPPVSKRQSNRRVVVTKTREKSQENPDTGENKEKDSSSCSVVKPNKQNNQQNHNRLNIDKRHNYNKNISHPGCRLPATFTETSNGRLGNTNSIEQAEASLNTQIGFMSSLPTWQSQISHWWNDFTQDTVSSEKDFVESFDEANQKEASSPLGFSFSPAGLLLPYHLGVATYLQHSGFLTNFVPVAGASAGAITAVLLACDVSIEETMQILYAVEHNLRMHGAARRLHEVLMKELDVAVYSNAHEIIEKRPGKVTVAYTQVWPILGGRFVTKFKSPEDIKECLAASCNIPFYFSRWPIVRYKGQLCIDGYFASRKTFGCPKTSALRDVFVLPFLSSSVHVKFPLGNVISPELEIYDSYLESKTEGKFASDFEFYLRLFPVPTPKAQEETQYKGKLFENAAEEAGTPYDASETSQQDASAEKACTPSPGTALSELAKMWGINEEAISEEPVLKTVPSSLPKLCFSIHQLLRIALEPTTDAIIQQLFEQGRADAYRWVLLEKYSYPCSAITVKSQVEDQVENSNSSNSKSVFRKQTLTKCITLWRHKASKKNKSLYSAV